MKPQIFTTLLLFFTPIMIWAQIAMEPGFNMLEEGHFGQAETFFAEVLEQEPANQTAQICYGRAVGLNGNPEKALTIFNKLADQTPDNLEIALNQSEAYMWAKQFKTAQELYDQILRTDTFNFTASMGAANARAGQKLYAEALPFIDKALNIQPYNTNALISKKFILLGIANNNKSQWKYEEAHHQLDSVEILFPNDINARMLRADVFLSEQKYRQAQSTFENMVADSVELVRAYSGLSYTSVLLHKKKDAVSFAEMAMKAAQESTVDSTLRINAIVNYANALGFKRAFKEAFQFLDNMEEKWGTHIKLQLTRARLKVWNSDLKEGIAIYDSLLQKDTTNFDLLMGIVEAKRANQQLDDALNFLQQARQILPDQPDAFRLWKELALADRPGIELNGSLLKDSGGNIGQLASAKINLGRIGRFQPYFEGSNWQAYVDGSTNKAQQNTILAGSQIQISPTIKGRFSGGASTYGGPDTTQLMALRGELGLGWRMGKYHQFDVELSRDFHNYTANLIASGIERNKIALTYNFSSPSRLGFYTQFLRVYQSDDNIQDLLFASLYFKVIEVPILKVGLNYSTFGFEREVSDQYFSPLSSTATEAFVQLVSDQSSRKKLVYHAFFSFGVQRVGINEPQQTTRLDVSLGYRFAPNFELTANYQAGNTVQSSISGYAYQRIGLKIKYQLAVNNRQ